MALRRRCYCLQGESVSNKTSGIWHSGVFSLSFFPSWTWLRLTRFDFYASRIPNKGGIRGKIFRVQTGRIPNWTYSKADIYRGTTVYGLIRVYLLHQRIRLQHYPRKRREHATTQFGCAFCSNAYFEETQPQQLVGGPSVTHRVQTRLSHQF
jgi:hypothetical protein